jgi:hypothetical protein
MTPIVLAELTSGAQLPAGWGVDSAPGRYRLRRRGEARSAVEAAASRMGRQMPEVDVRDRHPARRGPRPRPAAAGRPGVEAADLGFGTGLSGPVAACLPELTRMLLAEVTAGRGG